MASLFQKQIRSFLIKQVKFYNRKVPEIGNTADDILNEYYLFLFEEENKSLNEIYFINRLKFFINKKIKGFEIAETQKNRYLIQASKKEISR